MFIHRYSNSQAETFLANPETFAVITFNGRCHPSTPGIIHSGIQALPEQESVEVWEIPGAEVRREQRGNCYISQTEDLLCAAVWPSLEDCQNIRQATQKSYEQLLDSMQESACRYPLRFWNYIPKINHGEGDFEQYKQFCEGRLNAFINRGYATEQFPAASALGHSGDRAVFYVFASKTPAEHFENPLQEKAYCYPRQYGKSRPSFARATAFNYRQTSTLFVSGTASIVGHQTLHLSATENQVETTLKNMGILLGHTGQKTANLKSLKVYIRNPADLERVQHLVQSQFPSVPALYTRADICRANLLVEIEAHCCQT